MEKITIFSELTKFPMWINLVKQMDFMFGNSLFEYLNNNLHEKIYINYDSIESELKERMDE